MASTNGPESWASFSSAVALLRALGIAWALAGALAALRYRAAPRGTADVDFLVEWDERLVPALEAEGFVLRIYAERESHPHLIRARRGEEAVDLIVAETPYQYEALRRAADNVLTLEDVIVHKVIAGRFRDRNDIASILDAGPTLDRAYIRRWVEEFGFEGRLTEFGLD